MGYLERRQDELGRIVTLRFGLGDIATGFETIRSGTGLKVVIVP